MDHDHHHARRRGLAAAGLLAGGGVAAARALGRRLDAPRLAGGDVLRKRMLGTEARYRVLDAAPDTVEVEVLAAPGLAPGTHLRLSTAAARTAQRLPSAA